MQSLKMKTMRTWISTLLRWGCSCRKSKHLARKLRKYRNIETELAKEEVHYVVQLEILMSSWMKKKMLTKIKIKTIKRGKVRISRSSIIHLTKMVQSASLTKHTRKTLAMMATTLNSQRKQAFTPALNSRRRSTTRMKRATWTRSQASASSKN